MKASKANWAPTLTFKFHWKYSLSTGANLKYCRTIWSFLIKRLLVSSELKYHQNFMKAIPIMLLERFIISNCVIIVTFKRNTGLPYFQESTTMFDLHHLFVGAEIFSGYLRVLHLFPLKSGSTKSHFPPILFLPKNEIK